MTEAHLPWSAVVSKSDWLGWNIMVYRHDLAMWPYWALTRKGADEKAQWAIGNEIRKELRRDREKLERRRRYDSAEKWTVTRRR